MNLIKFIQCLFKGHDYKYSVKQEGNAVIARKDCKSCGFFKIKVDDGT